MFLNFSTRDDGSDDGCGAVGGAAAGKADNCKQLQLNLF